MQSMLYKSNTPRASYPPYLCDVVAPKVLASVREFGGSRSCGNAPRICDESPDIVRYLLRIPDALHRCLEIWFTALTLPHALGLRVCAFLPSESLSSQLCIPGCVGGYAD